MRRALATLTILGCLAGSATAQTEIRFMDMDPYREPMMKELVSEFETANPDIKVDYRWQANEAYKTGLKVMTSSANPPDVYFNWAGARSQDVFNQGSAADLTPTLSAPGNWSSGMLPAAVEGFRYDGKVIGAPALLSTSVFWKDDAFFEDNGLETPRSFSELISLCGKIREADPTMTPIALGSSEPWTLVHYISLLFAREVPLDVRSKDLSLTAKPDQLFRHPGYVRALQHMTDMQNAGCFNPGVNAVGPLVARSMFANGLSAMIFCQDTCTVQFDKEGAEGTYSFFPVPPIEGAAGNQNASLLFVSGYQLSSKTQHKAAAQKWLDFLLSKPAQEKLLALKVNMPARTDVANLDQGTATAREIIPTLPAIEEGVPALDVVLNATVANVVLLGSQELMNGSVTPEQLMERVRTEAVARAR